MVSAKSELLRMVDRVLKKYDRPMSTTAIARSVVNLLGQGEKTWPDFSDICRPLSSSEAEGKVRILRTRLNRYLPERYERTRGKFPQISKGGSVYERNSYLWRSKRKKKDGSRGKRKPLLKTPQERIKKISKGRRARDQILQYLQLGGRTQRAQLQGLGKSLGFSVRTIERVLTELYEEELLIKEGRLLYLNGYQEGIPPEGTQLIIGPKSLDFYVSNGWRVSAQVKEGDKIVLEKIWSPVGKHRPIS